MVIKLMCPPVCSDSLFVLAATGNYLILQNENQLEKALATAPS